MAGGGLRERLQNPLLAQGAVAADATESVRDDVLRHLREMCTTRLGSMRTRPDYGVPDVSEMVHAFPAAADTLAQSIRATIEKYEPRLTQVRIRQVPSTTAELVVRFEIQAVLLHDGRRAPVRFQTHTDASRRISIE